MNYARAHNEVIKNNDPTDHAEMIAIRKAAKNFHGLTWEIVNCILPVSRVRCALRPFTGKDKEGVLWLYAGRCGENRFDDNYI